MHGISRLKDKHSGSRCFLIGNGPSLTVLDLEKLTGEITFACNNIHLIFNETAWRPTYYTISDPLLAKSCVTQIKALTVTKIFSNSIENFFQDSTDVTWLKQIPYLRSDDLSEIAFSHDLEVGVYHAASTLFIQLQVAHYMGISEVYLLGVDFNYEVSAAGNKKSGMGTIIHHRAEKNHFHPSYRQTGEVWWLADKEFQEKTFEVARDAFRKDGRRILNASRKTSLKLFPLLNFDDLITSLV